MFSGAFYYNCSQYVDFVFNYVKKYMDFLLGTNALSIILSLTNKSRLFLSNGNVYIKIDLLSDMAIS